MTQDASEVVVGANGSVYTAPFGTALPAEGEDPTTALNAAFNEHGFVSEDGVTFRDGKEIEDILAWQAFYPIRKVVSAKSSGVEFVLRQFNPDNAELAFGGGAVDVTSGVATYTPPAPGELAELSLVVDWQDGDNNFRLVLPKGIVTEEVESELVRTAALDLPIVFEVTPEGEPTEGDPDSYPFYILSDHPAWVAT
jgi:hypothetical protein